MNQELQQQLMEFVYGLLDEGEANALCERITSEPDVARAYSKVKLQCDRVGRAARIDTATVAWIRPGEGGLPGAGPQAASTDRSANSYRQIANWCIGVAASGLIGLVGSAYWMSSPRSLTESTPVAIATPTQLQLVLTGPSKLHSEASNPFTVQVENQAGTPVSTMVNYRVYDEAGVVSWHESTATDESGNARFSLDGEVARTASRLEIAPETDSSAPVLRQLEATPGRFVTHLQMDRPLYEPGERVFYRSVTLSQYGLRADQEVTTSFDVVDSNDKQIEGSAHAVETERGVGSGAFALPDDLPDGEYTLIARSPDNLFREEWRDFHVRRYEAPKFNKKLELAKDSYTFGDQVDVDFSATRVAGEPLAEVPLKVQATLDGVALDAPEVKTDVDGKSRFALKLPESMERGKASVSVTVKDGENLGETITKEIPINLGRVNVDFYPEGGDFVAGLPSRVYFYGRDPLGQPTHIEGSIVDSEGSEITEVTTGHEGRGRFSITPTANEQYRLEIKKPVGVTKEVPLPIASIDRFATIMTGDGVFDATTPIDITLNQRTPAKPLIVAAYCRGAMVGQQTVEPDANADANAPFATFRGEIPLSDDAQGVIRLTVFDPAPSPPEPIAERLVYRRVNKKLDVQLTPDAEVFAPGQSAQLDLSISDENDVPVAAALGIAIVDDSILTLADDKSVRMPTYFHLLTEIDSSEQLEDANFYLKDEPESATALDSLLGTQGWRRFREVPGMQLAQRFGGESGGGGFGGGGGANDLFDQRTSLGRSHSAAWGVEAVVPVATANTIDVQKASVPRSSRSERRTSLDRGDFASSIVVVSLILLGLVGAASLHQVQSNRSLRVLAGIVAVASLFAGSLSLPTNPTQIASKFEDSETAFSGDVALRDQPESAITDGDLPAFAGEQAAGEAEEYMYEADMVDALAGAATAAPVASEPSTQRLGTVAAKDRNAEEEKELGPSPISKGGEKKADSRMARGKTAPRPAAETPPQPEAPTQPNAPEADPEPRSARSLMLTRERETMAGKNTNRELRREYADWFFSTRSNLPQDEQPSSTIFWHPLFIADDTGKATVYFKLPERASSFRAIVEAHGSARLGAGELLINSRER
ncbi:MAG: hypothetical protein H8E66_07395 [Planctomycetes bacterium]|nr:hypothetical protein [Planctomycetota bacterium]